MQTMDKLPVPEMYSKEEKLGAQAAILVLCF
jgi:hypothetical protein